MHIGDDADSGEIFVIERTKREVDDGSRTGTLLDQFTDPLASFTGDGAYNQDKV